MKWLLIILYNNLLFSCCLFAQNTAPVNTYAVVIGIAKYQSKALPALKYSDKDAGLFAKYLQSEAGGNVPPTHIKLLQNKQASIAAVYNAMDWLRGKCSKNDVAYIYFSGHGDVETKNTDQLGYLLAYNTPPNNYVNNAISIENINTTANTLSIKNGAKVIIVTDACHLGKLAGDFFKGKQLVAKQLSTLLNNEVRLAACQVNQEAAEGPDWGSGRGVFSYYLLNGLAGEADIKKDGNIQLWELSRFLDSGLISDKYLQINRHKQNPVTDGNPDFSLAVLASGSATKLAPANIVASGLTEGLMGFDAVAVQPIDYFFSMVKDLPLENIFDFTAYQGFLSDSLPLHIIVDCIENNSVMANEILKASGSWDIAQLRDTLQILKSQLQKNSQLTASFNERFVQMVQDKAQDMINAYLTGDLAELEKRQYYSTGNWQYNQFLSMLHVAMAIVPIDYYLNRVLAIDDNYISGLIARLNMATSSKTDSLLNQAFYYQQKALQLEPYAAYINNELGNLFLHQNKYDSANASFRLASILAPTWAVPWANQIRLNLAKNNFLQAKAAIKTADSLQPDLSFVMTNAGLVMEKDSNWLAAETHYLKAIELNNVHYLPYERLGNIYLNTGRYDDADYYIFQAKIRKDQFAVNDQYFFYGVEQGGGMPPTDSVVKYRDCVANLNTKNASLAPYTQLIKTLLQLERNSMYVDTAVQALRTILQQVPNMPLAHHYLGKLLYQQGRQSQAIAASLQAVQLYQTDTTLKSSLQNRFTTIKSKAHCLPNTIAYYNYDILEDHYLLGALYEQQKAWNKAKREYSIISRIENARQKKLAYYEGYEVADQPDPHRSEIRQLNSKMYHFVGAIKMGGTLKLATLYEKVKDYKKAEQVWLKQVTINQQLGRTSAFNSGKMPVDIGNGHLSSYWLTLNRDFEAGTYSFYKRMMALFPREFQWKENAGLFLYKRLAMMFDPENPQDYYTTHHGILSEKYPFVAAGASAAGDSIVYILPATGERQVTEMSVYDPVEEALQFLQQSITLSPDVKPRRLVAEAYADLNAWYGNKTEAIQQYDDIVKQHPTDKQLRQKLLNYLLANQELTAAYGQLDTLYHRKFLYRDEEMLLAEYHILSGKYNQANRLLLAYRSETQAEEYKKANLLATLNWLQGSPQKALLYLEDTAKQKQVKPDKDTVGQHLQNSFRLYSIARLYATIGNTDKAMAALQQALDAGFAFKYVLNNDVIWQSQRTTQAWKVLIGKYNFSNDYSTSREVINNYLDFRTPKR